MKKPERPMADRMRVRLRTEPGKREPDKSEGDGASRKTTRQLEAEARVEAFQTTLRARESEVRAWLGADPDRLRLLQKDPKKVVKTLADYLGIKLPEFADMLDDSGSAVDFDFEFVVSSSDPPLGSWLLHKVWLKVSESQHLAGQFQKDPEPFVRDVAAAEGADAEETEAVVRAVLITTRRTPAASSSPDLFRVLDLAERLPDLAAGPRITLRINRR